MGAYQIQQEDTKLVELLLRAERGEAIEIARDGAVVAKIIPFRTPESEASSAEGRPVRRRGGQNISGLAGKDLSGLDEPWPEDIQRAFGMVD